MKSSFRTPLIRVSEGLALALVLAGGVTRPARSQTSSCWYTDSWGNRTYYDCATGQDLYTCPSYNVNCTPPSGGGTTTGGSTTGGTTTGGYSQGFYMTAGVNYSWPYADGESITAFAGNVYDSTGVYPQNNVTVSMDVDYGWMGSYSDTTNEWGQYASSVVTNEPGTYKI